MCSVNSRNQSRFDLRLALLGAHLFMLPELVKIFKRNKDTILLVIIVFLLCLLCFGAGILTQFYLSKPLLKIETPAEE